MAVPTPEIHHLLSFRVVVVRVIESIVHDSIDTTISLTKMTSVINNHPLIQFSLQQMTDNLPTVTIRDVILSITKIFQASQISILKNNDNFKLKMDRAQFKELIEGLDAKFQNEILKGIKADEDKVEKLGKEIKRIESGELDQIIIKELHLKEQTDDIGEGSKQPPEEQVFQKEEVSLKKSSVTEPEPVDKFGAIQQVDGLSITDDGKSVRASISSKENPIEKKEKTPEVESKTEAKDKKQHEEEPQKVTTDADAETGVAETSEAAEGSDYKKRSADTDNSSQPKKKAKLEGLQPNQKLKLIANPLIASISSYKYASTFLTPVNEHQAPEYYSLIKSPRDLKTIKAMVKDGRIQTKEELERDILLMFANAIMYNKTGTDIYEWAKEMQVEVDKMLDLFKNVDE